MCVLTHASVCAAGDGGGGAQGASADALSRAAVSVVWIAERGEDEKVRAMVVSLLASIGWWDTPGNPPKGAGAEVLVREYVLITCERDAEKKAGSLLAALDAQVGRDRGRGLPLVQLVAAARSLRASEAVDVAFSATESPFVMLVREGVAFTGRGLWLPEAVGLMLDVEHVAAVSVLSSSPNCRAPLSQYMSPPLSLYVYIYIHTHTHTHTHRS